MKLIDEAAHRPWPVVSNKWIMKQSWRNVLFLHWPVSAGNLRPHLPPALEIDLFSGSAWIGIVAFTLKGIYPRGMPLLSVQPPFPEVNVRTYVQYKGKPGVYFLSLDVDNWASLLIAKNWYHLRYEKAHISTFSKGKTIYLESVRREDKTVSFKGEYTPVQGTFIPQHGTIDHWLTERYCLFSTNGGGRIYCGEIHHRPWPLQKVELKLADHSLFSPFEIDVSGQEPIAHYSKGVDSLMWNIKKAGVGAPD